MNMKREIAIGDIHGCFDALKTLVEDKIKFNPEYDTLIFMGDYIDRGKDVLKVIVYLEQLQDKYPDNIILLMGNHELMFLDYVSGTSNLTERANYLLNGGGATLDAFGGKDMAKEILLPFIKRCTAWHENEQVMYVHGGIPAGGSFEKTPVRELLWHRPLTKWNGKKFLVVGHTVVDEVGCDGKLVYVDTGCVFNGKLSAIDAYSGDVFTARTIPAFSSYRKILNDRNMVIYGD